MGTGISLFFFTRTMRFGSLGLEVTKNEWRWDWDMRKKWLRNGIYNPLPLSRTLNIFFQI